MSDPHLTPEREAELTERLHQAWHPAPNACTPRRPCYERRRARGAVRVLGPTLARYLAEDVEREAQRIERAFLPLRGLEGGR